MPQHPRSPFHILIPAYHAHSQLSVFLPQLLTFVDSSQILIVLDGPDPLTEKLCITHSIQYLVHQTNRGKGAALQSGFDHLGRSTPWIITMDADGQHSPSNLPLFIETTGSAPSNCAVVVGSRERSLKTMPAARILSNALTSWALSLFCGQKINDSQCGYRAYATSYIEKVTCSYTHFEYESEILLRISHRKGVLRNIPIQTIYGDETSNISHIKDTLRWVKAVIFTLLQLSSKG